MTEDNTVALGVVMAFMVMLSAQDGFTFRVSNEMLQCFPYNDYELHADRDTSTGDTVFSLQKTDALEH